MKSALTPCRAWLAALAGSLPTGAPPCINLHPLLTEGKAGDAGMSQRTTPGCPHTLLRVRPYLAIQPAGQGDNTCSAAADSGTSRVNPFFVSGRCTTRRRRSTIAQVIPTISPCRMAVSIAKRAMAAGSGLTDWQAASRRASSSSTRCRSRSWGSLGLRTDSTGLSSPTPAALDVCLVQYICSENSIWQRKRA